MYDGHNVSAFLHTVVEPNVQLAAIAGISFGPDENLYVAVGNLVGESFVCIPLSFFPIYNLFHNINIDICVQQYYWETVRHVLSGNPTKRYNSAIYDVVGILLLKGFCVVH